MLNCDFSANHTPCHAVIPAYAANASRIICSEPASVRPTHRQPWQAGVNHLSARPGSRTPEQTSAKGSNARKAEDQAGL